MPCEEGYFYPALCNYPNVEVHYISRLGSDMSGKGGILIASPPFMHLWLQCMGEGAVQLFWC